MKTLFQKLKSAGNDFLEGYDAESFFINNIIKSKAHLIHENPEKLIENLKIMYKNKFTKIGMYLYFATHLIKGNECAQYLLNYSSQHPESFNSNK